MSSNTEHTDKTYSPLTSDLPRIQIPLGKRQPGLTVEGKFMHLHELPPKAKEAYKQFVEGGGRPGGMGQTKVHMCEDCTERDDGYDVGYLTTSDKAGSNAYHKRKYTCSNTWEVESTSMNGNSAGQWGAPSSWNIDLKINGKNKRIIDEDTESDPTYTLYITEHDRYHADSEILGQEEITLPDDDDTVTGEVNGKSWEAVVEYLNNDTVKVEWRRITKNGETVTYAFKEGDRHPDREFVELNPNPDEYADKEGYDIKELSTVATSYRRERECESTKFKTVWPSDRVFNDGDIIPINDLTDDDVPNTKSHLSRIQGQIDDSISQGEMLRTVAEAVKEFWEIHGTPDWAEYET